MKTSVCKLTGPHGYGLFYPGIMKQGLGLKGLGWTVLVTLLISDTNSTAYPTLIYGLYLPYGPGVGLRGLGWAFSEH